MRFKKLTYILASCSLLAAAAACTDDYFDRWGGSNANSNVVTYSPTVGRSVGDGSRAAEPEYQPLILTGERPSDSLYLHTFAVNKIGYQPGESTTGLDSRSNPIEDIDSLITYHTNFKVHAQFSEGDRRGEEYIGWSDTKVISADKRIWNTASTNFWPSQEKLAFHAVSPASEFNSLEGLRWNNDSEKFSMAFDYKAKKSSDGKSDANVQPDLLVAASECNKAEANSNYGGHAPLKFHHALSAIKFAIRDVANGKIKDISIRGVHSQGHCTYTADTDGTNGQFIWSDVTGTETYTQEFNYSFTQDASPIDPKDESHDIEMWATMPSKTFMLIPQQIPADAEIVITLERNRTGNPNAQPEEITLHGNIVKNSVTEWKPGYEYIYTISTSNDNWVYVLEACGNHKFTPNYSAPDGGHGLTELSKSEEKEKILNHYERRVNDPNDLNKDSEWHEDAGLIFVFAPRNQAFDDYEENAHFHVRSFRFRVNKPDVKEILPWKAKYTDFYDTEGVGMDIGQYQNNNGDKGFPGEKPVGERKLPYNEWITDKSVLEGSGSFEHAGEEKRFTLAPHNLTSNWLGDQEMQNLPAYSGNSKEKPWDLSRMQEYKAGNLPLNTANTYVIDRQGWYILPCVYGNAITNGEDHSEAWTQTTGKNIKADGLDFQYLKSFVDHTGADITGPWIPYANDSSVATIAWTDVYNAISDISIVTLNSHKYIKFKANQYNLMQGNVVIALLDKNHEDGGNVIWSWQIWINEHWLDSDRINDADGKSHAFADAHESDFSTYHDSPSKRRERGDLEIQIPDATNYHYWISPVNLGWCDPKSQYYLRRVGYMNFEQYRPDKTTKTGKKTSLHIFQNGLFFDYKYGNNTYYQFGRKEPMVGYEDHSNTVKRNFGKYKYNIEQGRVELKEAILHPNTLFGKGETGDGAGGVTRNNDWVKEGENWVNLWNNTIYQASKDEFYAQDFTCNGIKTVYDPCPPGYMVPPAAVWRIIGPAQTYGYKDGKVNYDDYKGLTYINGGQNIPDLELGFNGVYLGNSASQTDELYFAYNINADNTKANGLTDDNKITLTSTGHRWYSDFHSASFTTGDNFNSFCVYLWSSTPSCRKDRSAFSVALGRDTDAGQAGTPWVRCTYFCGRRSMARPIRPVREIYTSPHGKPQ